MNPSPVATSKLLAAILAVTMVASDTAVMLVDPTDTRFLSMALLALVAVVNLVPPFPNAGPVVTALSILGFGAVQVALAIAAGSSAEAVYLTRAALTGAAILASATLAGILGNRLRRLQADMRRQQITIRELTTREATGALKEDQMRRRLEEEILRARRYGYQISLLVLAHETTSGDGLSDSADVGEEALAEVARVAQSRLRPMDSLGHHGQRAFTILLPHTPLGGAQTAAAKIVAEIEKTTGVAMHAGIAEFPADAATAGDLIEEADQALGFARLASLKVASRTLLS